jgi:hypothetical protein
MRDLRGGCVCDKIKALLQAHENTEPEEKCDGYQIDDGAGDNSHGQTGVAAGTFVGNSLLLGTPPEPPCSVIRMSNGSAEASRSDGLLWMALELVAAIADRPVGCDRDTCGHQRRRSDRFRNAEHVARMERSGIRGRPLGFLRRRSRITGPRRGGPFIRATKLQSMWGPTKTRAHGRDEVACIVIRTERPVGACDSGMPFPPGGARGRDGHCVTSIVSPASCRHLCVTRPMIPGPDDRGLQP